MTSPAIGQGMEESIDYGSYNNSSAQQQSNSSSPTQATIPQPYGSYNYPHTYQQSPPQQPPVFYAPTQAAPPLQGYASQFTNNQPVPNVFPPQQNDGMRVPLQGNANLNVQQFDSSLQASPPPVMSQPFQQPTLYPQTAISAPTQTTKPSLFGNALKSLLSGGVNKNVPPAERPWWIPANAFTNDSMVAPYHNMDIFWWDKRSMPDKPQWVRLAGDVTRYWNGYVAEPCFVYVEPFKPAPGNFVFHSRQSGGPKGWLQSVNQPDSTGFPLYRYWLDQPH